MTSSTRGIDARARIVVAHRLAAQLAGEAG